MDQHRHLRASAIVGPITKLRAVASAISLDGGQIAEIDSGERIGDRGQGRRLYRRVECKHAAENAETGDDQAGETPQQYSHPILPPTNRSPQRRRAVAPEF